MFCFHHILPDEKSDSAQDSQKYKCQKKPEDCLGRGLELLKSKSRVSKMKAAASEG